MFNLNKIGGERPNDQISTDGLNPMNESHEDLSPEDKAINDAIDRLKMEPIQPIQRLRKPAVEYKTEKPSLEEVQSTQKEPDDDDLGYWDAVSTGIGKEAINFYDGVENLALATGRVAGKGVLHATKAFNGVLNFFGVKDIVPDEDLDALLNEIDSEDNIDRMKKAFRVSNYLNDIIGKPIVPSTDDIRQVYEEKEQKFTAENAPISLKGAYYASSIGTEIGEMFLFPWGRTADLSFKGVQKGSVVAGAVVGLNTEGATASHKQALEEAVKTYAMSALFGHAVQGVVHGAKSFYLNSAVGQKTLDGFEQLAKESKGEKVVEDAKEAFVKNSVYNTWEDMPIWDRTLFVMGMSTHGEATLAQMSRFTETSQTVADTAKKIDAQMQKDLAQINDLAKKIAVPNGTKIKTATGEVVEASQSEAYALLHRAGLFKGANAGSGVAPQKSLTEAGYDIYDAIMRGTKSAPEAEEKLKSAIRILGNAMNKEEKKLLVDIAEGGVRPVVSKNADRVIQDILQDVKAENAELNPNQTYPELENILKQAVHATMNPRDIDGITEVSVSPHSVWSMYKTTREALEATRAQNGGVEVANATQLLDSIVKYVDKIAPDTNAGQTLHKLIDFERERVALVSGKGINDLAKNSGLLSPREMREAFYKIGMSDPKKYRDIVASIKKKEDQEAFELATLRAFAYQGKGSLAEMKEAREFAKQTKSTVTKMTSTRATDLGAFQPVTKAGRQMKEYLQISTRLVDKLTEGLPTAGGEISIYTLGYRYGSKYLFRSLGALQSPKNAAKNIPYVLHKMEKLAKHIDTTKSPSIINLASVKAGSTIIDDVTEFPQGVQHLRMASVLKSLRPFGEDPKGGSTSPTAPTPPPTGIAPSPMPMPMPKPKPLQTVVPEMSNNDGVVPDLALLTPADRVALDDIATNALKQVKGHLEAFQKARGMPLSAQQHTAEEWADFNAKVTALQRGSKTKVIVTPDGQPAVVLGTKGFRFSEKTRERMSKNANGLPKTPLHELLDDLTMQKLRDIAKALGDDSMFENVTVKMKTNTSNSRIYHKPDGSKEVELGIKPFRIPDSDKVNHTRKWEQQYMSSLSHELQHLVQSYTGRKYFTSQDQISAEVDRRTRQLLTEVIQKGGIQVASGVKKLLQTDTPPPESQIKAVYDYIGHDPKKNGTILPETLAHRAIGQATGMTPNEVRTTLSTYEVYRQEANEVEARLMGFIASKGQLDFTDDALFKKFIDFDADRPTLGLNSPLTTIWQAGANLERLLGKWDFLK